jgi:hypothetical protein
MMGEMNRNYFGGKAKKIRLKDDIKTDHRERDCEGGRWMN